jgi:hypothetical protein
MWLELDFFCRLPPAANGATPVASTIDVDDRTTNPLTVCLNYPRGNLRIAKVLKSEIGFGFKKI